MWVINSWEEDNSSAYERIEWTIYMPDSKGFGLYIDTEKWIVEIWLQYGNNPNLMRVQNVKELLDSEKQERIVDAMENIGYNLVWITDIEWNIPKEIIEAFKSESNIRKEWILKQMDDDNANQKMIFMKIPWMKKVKKVQEKTKLKVSKTFTIPEENDWIIEGLLSISDKVEGLYVNTINWTVDRVMKYPKINRAEFVNLEEHLETMEEVELAERIKTRWYYFVWATEIWWAIPKAIIKSIGKKPWNILLHQRIPESEDELMIFALIPELAWEQAIPLSQEEILFGEKWLQGFEVWKEKEIIEPELDSRNCWLFINHETGTVEIYFRNWKNVDNPIRDIRDELFEDEDLDYVSQMESHWYYLVWYSDELWILPQYTIKAFNVQGKDIEKFHFQKLSWTESDYMIFKYLPEMPKLDYELVEWEDNWIFRNIANERMRKLNIWLLSSDSKKFNINEWVFNWDENAEWIYFNPENDWFELIFMKPWSKSLTISSTIWLINGNINELIAILKLKENWYYFVWYTNETWWLPHYLKWMFRFDRYNTILRPTIPERWGEQMIFVRWTWMEWVWKNPSSEFDWMESEIPSKTQSAVKFFKWKHWLFINEELWTVELYLKSWNNNWESIVDIKTLLNWEIENLLVRERETMWYHFVWFTNEKWEFPIMVHEAVNIYENDYTSIPRIWDKSWRRLIFVKIPNMPAPKETYEEFMKALDEEDSTQNTINLN